MRSPFFDKNVRKTDFVQMVEVGGVEPPSESTLTGPSPGADGYCGSLALPVPLPVGKPSRRPVR